MNAKQHRPAPSSWPEEAQGPETGARSRAIKFGLIGSLAGTIAMDLIMIVESLLIGEPVDGFVALIGSVVGGGSLEGVGLHLLIGSLLGILFGTAISKVRSFSIESVWKGVWLGVLAGLVTIPLGCVPFAIIIDFPVIEMVRFSFIPHLVWGAVLGLIAGCAVHSNPHCGHQRPGTSR
jgi:hypothetical protein